MHFFRGNFEKILVSSCHSVRLILTTPRWRIEGQCICLYEQMLTSLAWSLFKFCLSVVKLTSLSFLRTGSISRAHFLCTCLTIKSKEYRVSSCFLNLRVLQLWQYDMRRTSLFVHSSSCIQCFLLATCRKLFSHMCESSSTRQENASAI